MNATGYSLEVEIITNDVQSYNNTLVCEGDSAHESPFIFAQGRGN